MNFAVETQNEELCVALVAGGASIFAENRVSWNPLPLSLSMLVEVETAVNLSL